MTQDQNSLHPGGIGIVGIDHQRLDAGDRRRTAHIVPHHLPAIPLKVADHLCKRSGQGCGERIVHQQDHLATVLHHGEFHTRIDIPVAIPHVRGVPNDLVLVGGIGLYGGITVAQCCSTQSRDRVPPASTSFQIA